ncbi:hypothetical protein HDV05_004718 [Chytridiales sp. JEL 0842]|nr:hypothetical protein HDV05_004718 [Chytridiales sp. JEL 0842]
MDPITEKLLSIGTAVIDSKRKEAMSKITIKAFLFRPDVIVTFVFSLLLFAFYIQTAVSLPADFRHTDSLVEGVLLLLALGFNAVIFLREWKLTVLEMGTRLRSLLEQLRESGLGQKQDLKIPTNIASVSVARVLRNETISCYPYNLLVENDIIQMAFGDKAPCIVKHCTVNGVILHPEVSLQKGQILRPSHFGIPMQETVSQTAKANGGQFYFKLMETPLQSTFSSALDYTRPETVVSRQLQILLTSLNTRVLWIFMLFCLIVNIFRYSFLSTTDVKRREDAFQLFVLLQFYAILPLLPLSLPALCLVARSYGNAQIVCLLEVLQSSKVEFKDEENIDEFDEAPPPTKDVVTDWGSVWKMFVDQLIRVDVSFLARTTGLVESLASTTVICSIDREGSISLPYPSVDKLFLLGENGDPIILDVEEEAGSTNGIRFEDKDWEKFMPLLKPIGLHWLLQTHCGNPSARRRLENHRKSNIFCIDGRVKAARQTCFCRIGWEIGFTEQALANFSPQASIQLFDAAHPLAVRDDIPDYHFEIPRIHQIMTDGHAKLVLDTCADFWNGTTLEPITEQVEKKITEFYQNALFSDMQVIGFSYRPLPNVKPFKAKTVFNENLDVFSASQLDLSNFPGGLRSRFSPRKYFSAVDSPEMVETLVGDDFFNDALAGQTFLGMATLFYQPKPNVIDFIEDLDLAGIRFVYFSGAPERESKAYAERLGLEIDWNSCILLSSPDGNGNGYLELHDMKAKLPRGVENIREHLKNVDDVPLHVSLFAECSPMSIKEMVKIFQENGEVVCCIGSSLNEMNVESFAIADIAVAIDPFTALKAKKTNHGSLSSLSLGAGFTTAPCALKFHFDTSLYSLAQLIREARTLADNARQGFSFYLGCQLSLSFLLMMSYCLLLPPILTGYQVLWVLWVVLPIQAAPFLFTPHDPDVMKLMPVKNSEHLKNKWRFAAYYAARFSVPIVGCLAVFILTLWNLTSRDGIRNIFGFFGAVSWLQMTKEESWALLLAQNVMLFTYILFMVPISSTFLYRTRSFIAIPPWKNKLWVYTSLLSVGLQVSFSAVSLRGCPYYLSDLPWYIYFVAAFVVAIIIPIQELVKAHDRKEWDRFQKFAKLQFNTKLGMHSPL